MVSSMVIPESVHADILDRDAKGQQEYKQFIKSRLLLGSTLSTWDRIKQMKLKTFSTWIAKTEVKADDKVAKLREERQLLGKFLVIYQSRPELLPNLPGTIGKYETAVTPRSMFSADGALLIPEDKNSFMQAIEEAVFPEQLTIPKEETEVVPLEIEYDVGNESLCQSEPSDINLEEELQVIIFDGMAVLQSMKKNPTMQKIFDLADQFVKRVRRMMKDYLEGWVLFDKYLENSLKMNTRKQRGGTQNFAFSIHDEMNISKLSLK